MVPNVHINLVVISSETFVIHAVETLLYISVYYLIKILVCIDVLTVTIRNALNTSVQSVT